MSERLKRCKASDPCNYKSSLNDECFYEGCCGDHVPMDPELKEILRTITAQVNKTIRTYRPPEDPKYPSKNFKRKVRE